MIKQIPNILTLSNLFSGCIAITMAFQGNFKAVVIWVIVAALFDFLDGMAARLLKAYSDIGKELDSLADVVSFGVAPAAGLFILLREKELFPYLPEQVAYFIPYLAFIIPLFSALRLAQFNIDERQTTSFLGLPTPANGLFWISYCYGIQYMIADHPILIYLTFALIFLLSWLMVSGIPMFSLKIKKIAWKGNQLPLLLGTLMVAFVLLWGIRGIAWGIIAYILLSLFTIRQQRIVK